MKFPYLDTWRDLITNDGNDDLLSTPSTAPGRVRTFLTQDYYSTIPASCALTVYKNNLFELLKLCALDLCGGACTKVILDNYQKPQTHRNFSWSFSLSPMHPDYCKLSDRQKEYLTNGLSEDIYLIKVADSMNDSKSEGISIIESWTAFIEAAIAGKNIIVDLSQLRPYGTIGSNQRIISSGPIGRGKDDESECSFLSIYIAIAKYLRSGKIFDFLYVLGCLNDTLRRGGYKRGIITTAMIYSNPFIEEYLDAPLGDLPGGTKKGIRIDEGVIPYTRLIDKIAEKANSESLFIVKVGNNPDVFDNVCVGIRIPDRGTCLIWRINLAKINDIQSIPLWFGKATSQLALLHIYWRKERPKQAQIYAPLYDDRQICLDVMGIVSALAGWKIKYQEFLGALVRYNNGIPGEFESDRLVEYLARGFAESTRIADEIMEMHELPPLERIHTPGEPAMRHSYECTDLKGNTITRSIYPPFSKIVKRESEHEAVAVYHHGQVETPPDITPDHHEAMCEEWSRFINNVGRSHELMSYDAWHEITPEWIEYFIKESPLGAKYYSNARNFDQSYMRKRTTTVQDEGCAVCAE